VPRLSTIGTKQASAKTWRSTATTMAGRSAASSLIAADETVNSNPLRNMSRPPRKSSDGRPATAGAPPASARIPDRLNPSPPGAA
jgi:hypothetical protein